MISIHLLIEVTNMVSLRKEKSPQLLQFYTQELYVPQSILHKVTPPHKSLISTYIVSENSPFLFIYKRNTINVKSSLDHHMTFCLQEILGTSINK